MYLKFDQSVQMPLKTLVLEVLETPGFNHLLVFDKPSMTKIFDTHAHDYNSRHGKTCSQSASELSRRKKRDRHLADLVKS